MKVLSNSDIAEVSGAASKSTIIKSGARIIAKNVARGFLMGSGIGTVAAVIWFAYDAYELTNS